MIKNAVEQLEPTNRFDEMNLKYCWYASYGNLAMSDTEVLHIECNKYRHSTEQFIFPAIDVFQTGCYIFVLFLRQIENK